MTRGDGGKVFLEKTGFRTKLHKTTPGDLHLKSRSKVNPSVTNHGYLYCSVLKALYGFKEKRGHNVSSISNNSKWHIWDLGNV